jgi:hypothetical protein
VAGQALFLLRNLVCNTDVRAEELWATLESAGREGLIFTATTAGKPDEAWLALNLLLQLTANSNARKAELWTTLGTIGRERLIIAATTTKEPEAASLALNLLLQLSANSDARKAELWTIFGTVGHEGLIIAVTTAGEPEDVRIAIKLLNIWQDIPQIKTAIWTLLQPRLSQLWAVTQRPIAKYLATNFLFEQIREDAHRTRQAFNALNAAIPAVSTRHTIAMFRKRPANTPCLLNDYRGSGVQR